MTLFMLEVITPSLINIGGGDYTFDSKKSFQYMLKILPFFFLLTTSLQAEPCADINEKYDVSISASDIARLKEESAQVPFSSSLTWIASKNEKQLLLIGVQHYGSQMFDRERDIIYSKLKSSDVLFVESSPSSEAELEDYISNNLNIISLDEEERLSQFYSTSDWATIVEAASRREIPSYFADMLKPWYLAIMISHSLCSKLSYEEDEVEEQLVSFSIDNGINVLSLDDGKSLLSSFSDIPFDGQLRWLLLTAENDLLSEKIFNVTTDFYHDGEHHLAKKATDFLFDKYAEELVEADRLLYERLDQIILFDRNLSWSAKLDEMDVRIATVIVGSDHFSGDHGLLNLLEKKGWSITPLPSD